MGAPFCPMGRQKPSIKGDDKILRCFEICSEITDKRHGMVG
jgi:hypothetical protein